MIKLIKIHLAILKGWWDLLNLYIQYVEKPVNMHLNQFCLENH